MSKRHTILPTSTCFFILGAGKIKNAQELKIKISE